MKCKNIMLVFLIRVGILAVCIFFQFGALTHAKATDNAQWIMKKVGGDAQGGTAKWCGSDSNTIVWQGVTSGIHWADISSGTTKVITQSWHHSKPFCSPDGRFVFFVDESTQKTMAYDLNTSKISNVGCLSNKVMLSPDMKAAFSVDLKSCDFIDLPWGESIAIKKISGIPNQTDLSSLVTWFPDRKKVVLTFIEGFKPKKLSQQVSIAIYDFANLKLTPIPLTLMAFQIRISSDAKRLFFIGENYPRFWNELPPLHLFKVDIEHIPSEEKLVHPNVVDFDVHHQNGMAILTDSGEVFVGLQNERGLKQISHQKMSSPLMFSPDGHKLLSMKDDPYLGEDGPVGPPITSSIYVFIKP